VRCRTDPDRAFRGSLAKVPRRRSGGGPDQGADGAATKLDWSAVDEVYFGCANQAGEDNRNVARMALLLAGLPESVPASPSTVSAPRDWTPLVRRGARSVPVRSILPSRRRRIDDASAVRDGQGAEAFARSAEIYDTTIGWRFINPLMKAQYGVDAMPETGENVAEEFQVSRADQDAFAIPLAAAGRGGDCRRVFRRGNHADLGARRKAGPITVDKDEHPRPETTLEGLTKLKPIVRNPGTVTAGNASGVNDGAAAMILASEAR